MEQKDELELKQRIGRIQSSEKNIQVNFWIVGSELIKIKELVPYGKFERTIEDNFTFTPRMGRKLMLIAKRFKSSELSSELGLNDCLELIQVTSDNELDEEGKIPIDEYVNDNVEETEEKFADYRSEGIYIPTRKLEEEKERKVREAMEEAKNQIGYFKYVEDKLDILIRHASYFKILVTGLKSEKRRELWFKYRRKEKVADKFYEFKEIIKKMEV